MPKVKSTAFDLKQSQLKGDHADIRSYEDLAIWLSNELDVALEARGSIAEDIRYRWTLYEQGRTRGTRAPWPDAADLTSPYGTEFTDATVADVMQTIFVEPVCTVEGWGESAKRAPFVEEFHQRTQEDERLQEHLEEVILRSLIEPAGILEVSESVDLRRERKTIRAQVVQDELTGAPVMGEDNQPLLVTDEHGNFAEAGEDPNIASAETDIDTVEPVRMGPDYDVVPYLDFLRLPGHARNKTQVWGYAKRFWRRVPELDARASQGIYDKKAVEDCGTENERDTNGDDGPKGVLVPTQKGPTAQKELFEVQFLANLDGKGERWWRATLHKDKRALLRLKVDDHTTRFIPFVPFPKPGSLDGYSLIEKMLTVIEEDTAVRNMRADKAALAIANPIKRLQGALWDPYEQPFAPRAVIDVRDMNEVQEMPLSDVPQSINVWKQDVRTDAERLVGRNDVSLGVQSQESKTLGEVQLTAGYAAVRTNRIVRRLQESIEELFQARHTIWKRTLAGQAQGMPLRTSMEIGLEARGFAVDSIADGRITAQMLEGQFWFKPRGSVETADLNRQRADFNQMLAQLPALFQTNPMIAALFQTLPAAKSLVEQMLRVNRWPDKQAFLGSEAQGVLTAQNDQRQLMADPMMQALMGMAGGGGNTAAGTPGGGALPPSPSGPPDLMAMMGGSIQ